jgi:hypothetical protein
MSRAKIISFWSFVAINVALAAAVTLRLPVADGIEPFPIRNSLLIVLFGGLIVGGAGLHAEVWALVRRTADTPPMPEDAARGVKTTYGAAWTALLGFALVVLAFQLYRIGWSRGVLPPLDPQTFSRVWLTLGGAFLIFVGNAVPKSALAVGRWRKPEAAFRIMRGRGWVFTLFGLFLVIGGWTLPGLVMTLGSLVFTVYIVARSIFLAAEGRAERRMARAQAEGTGAS